MIEELPEAVPGSAGEILHTFGHPVDPFTYGGIGATVSLMIGILPLC